MRALSSASSRFLGVALAPDELDFGFDRVGVRHLAAAFLLARDIEEVFGLLLALLGVGVLAHGRDHGVVALRDGRDQAARGDFRFGARHGFGHLHLVVVGALNQIENVAVHDSLVVVDVGAVVGDERAGGRAVGLGVDELVERADTRQPGGPGLHGILAGEQRGDVGGEDLRTVGASALHGVLESEAQGSVGGSGGRVLRQRALAQGQTQPHNQRNVRHWKIQYRNRDMNRR